MKLYQYSILYLPKEKKEGETPPAKILVKPTEILASDDAKAMMIAARAIPEQYLDKLDEIQLAVRPF